MSYLQLLSLSFVVQKVSLGVNCWHVRNPLQTIKNIQKFVILQFAPASSGRKQENSNINHSNDFKFQMPLLATNHRFHLWASISIIFKVYSSTSPHGFATMCANSLGFSTASDPKRNKQQPNTTTPRQQLNPEKKQGFNPKMFSLNPENKTLNPANF